MYVDTGESVQQLKNLYGKTKKQLSFQKRTVFKSICFLEKKKLFFQKFKICSKKTGFFFLSKKTKQVLLKMWVEIFFFGGGTNVSDELSVFEKWVFRFSLQIQSLYGPPRYIHMKVKTFRNITDVG
jgi:hypothetical protein